ncbi:MAG: TonB-dependent receptor [Pseudomonadota bacterium]
MSIRILRAFVLGHSALVAFGCADAIAQASMDLPQITVRAPSPIVRRAAPPSDATPAPAAPQPMQGELPIVTDQFATVTVVPTEEIQRSTGTTLGDVLSSKPGIVGSSFAPGASSRPIVRGLDMHRVRVQEGGIGSNGASDLGEDHGVPIDPLAARQIEVIRGPATLRYGSQAIGGVVDAQNNRIPTAIPQRGFSAEFNGAASSVDRGLEGSMLLDAGKGNFAFHADAYGRNANDYRVPSYPYLFDNTRNFNGKQPNTASRADGQAVGGSYIFDGGFVGMAVSQFNSLYHIPGIDGEDHGTRIDMKQTKVTSKGEYRPSSSAVDAVRFWLGYTDYKHNEIGLADPTNAATDGVRQTFTNKEFEGRAEVQLAPVTLPFATMTTALGVQGWHQQLTAPSPDDPGSILNGLFDPNRTALIAGYIFNEFKLTNTLKAQVAGRIERTNVSGSAIDFPSNVFDVSGLSPSTSRERTFAPKSGSIGFIQDLPWDLSASLTGQYVERAPRAPELFSRGPHDATGTFDIGNPNLNIETAKSVEAGLRRAKGPFRFELTGYYTRFNNFIYRNLTGQQCNETSCGQNAGDEELNQAVYAQRDATFRGGEFQFQWDLVPAWGGFWGVDGQYDIVRATFTDGTNVPRIPPQRAGAGVYFRSDEWLARVSLLHAFAQNNIAVVGETPTAGYNNLKVELSKTKRLKNDPTGIQQITMGIVGNNLLNENIRNHVSFTKDQVLLPGANVRVFASVKY